ncbi:MAG TPA: hypothetical protein PLU39_00945 [Armatimonadota bacterium]|nr:hypothetical protein [Armatimonadota bacterium]HOJ21554.1 hypothetical protein [Armatimonadota bacterium]HPO71480.1 hypothetical protein [Armatimonadota bacterium]HPT96411.1 hypothetical protein [Armatimonadota bacterium]
MASEDARWLLRCAAGHRDGHLWWWALAAFVLLLVLWNSWEAPQGEGGLQPSDTTRGAATAWGAFTGVAATVGDVTAAPHSFLGVIVTVSGEVSRVIDARAFTLGGKMFGCPELLVIAASPIPGIQERPPQTPLLAGDLVLVTGPVHSFNRVHFEREAGVVLGKARFAGWSGRPAILALDVRVTPRLLPVPGTLPAAPATGAAPPIGSAPALPASPVPSPPAMGYIPEPPGNAPAVPSTPAFPGMGAPPGLTGPPNG